MRFHHFRYFGVFTFVCLLTVVAQGQTTIYVDDDAATGGDGLSWATAYDDLQLALDAAKAPGSTVVEIRVAGGTYRPTWQSEPGVARTETFQLINGVAIRGGYRGCPDGDCGGGDPDERDVDLYETILSGDLAGDDLPDFVNNDENSYHVTKGNGTDGTAVLDGFTITSGNADGDSPNYNGAGIYCDSGDPTLTNCTISGNSAYYRGGGVYCYDHSSPTLTNCTISENSADYHGGGGVFCFDYSSPTLTNCTISGNSADDGGGVNCRYNSSPTFTNCTIGGNSAYFGGGMYCYNSSSPTLTNCTISGNSADHYGGGVFCFGTSPTLTKCTISENSAGWGGGIYCKSYGDPTLTNCTISGNSADYGGGVYCLYNSSPILTNCTISENTADRGGGVYCYDYSSPTLTNCTIGGNSADHYGGGVNCNFSSSPTLTNCTISGNSAYYYGGGVSCVLSCSPTLTNCTISENTADRGGGVDCYYNSSPTLTNCILWGDGAADGPEIYISYYSTLTISYSAVEGGEAAAFVEAGSTLSWETGNISDNPLFVRNPNDGGNGWGDDPATPDVDEGANDDYGDLRLLPGSPCIDTGDPASDFGLEPEPDGGRINMGAFGNTPEATSKAGLGIAGYGLVSRTRVGRTVFAYELTVTVHNSSDAAAGDVVLTLLDMPDNVTIGDEPGEDTVDVGPIAAGATVTSTDTFKIIVDRTVPVSSLEISWSMAYTINGESGEYIFSAPLSGDDLDGDPVPGDEPDPGDDDELDVDERVEDMGRPCKVEAVPSLSRGLNKRT